MRLGKSGSVEETIEREEWTMEGLKDERRLKELLLTLCKHSPLSVRMVCMVCVCIAHLSLSLSFLDSEKIK